MPWTTGHRGYNPGVDALGEGPVGDIVTAILQVDSRLKAIYRRIEASSRGTEPADELTAVAGLATSTSRDALGRLDVSVVKTAEDARELLDGYCTVVFVIVQWAMASGEEPEAKPEDALATVVRMLFSRLRLLKRAVPSASVPTMIALVTAAAMGHSPQRWREQYGHVWSEGDVAALEATAVCLAEWVNKLQGSPDAALRLIMEAFERAEANLELPGEDQG
jgi:hypothetical protein